MQRKWTAVSHPELVFITFLALADTKWNSFERVTRSKESQVKGGVIRQDDSEKLIQVIIKKINKVPASLLMVSRPMINHSSD